MAAVPWRAPRHSISSGRSAAINHCDNGTQNAKAPADVFQKALPSGHDDLYFGSPGFDIFSLRPTPALRFAIASDAIRGRADEVDQAPSLCLRIGPPVTITWNCKFYPLRRNADWQRLILAMRKAGVAE